MPTITVSRDDNRVAGLVATSSVDGVTPVIVYADPTTHRLLVDLPSGTGTVTSVSVVSANGFAGTVANPTTTPAITLSTSVTGILQGNGTAISAATVTGSGAVVLATSPVITTSTLSGTTLATTLKSASSAGITLQNNGGGNVIIAGAGGGTGVTFGGGIVVGANVTLGNGNGWTDSLGNKVLVTSEVASPVNYFTVSNSATTNSLKISAAGTDTNISIGLVPKGTGTVQVPTPVNSGDAATKGYVDNVAQGLSVKQSVQAATAAALPANTYNNGSSGVGATLTGVATGVLTVDGYTVALNDRILVKNESTAANNGIYLCTVAGAVGVAYVLTRATDSNTSAEIVGGFTFAEQGTVNGSGGFINTNTGTITIGTTSITYTQFSGAGEITAGNGLSKSGNTLSIDTTITVDKTTAQTLTNKTITDTTNNVAANSLKSATTLVDISSATAPSLGQVLTATSSTAATWQTPSGGGRTLYAIGNSSASQTVTWSNGQTQTITLAVATTTFTFASPVSGEIYILQMAQDATGGRLVSYPATCFFPGGVTPVLSSAANAVDILTFVYTGTDYMCIGFTTAEAV